LGNLLRFLPFAKDFTQSLDFKILLVLFIIFIIAGILLGTLFGRMQKGKEEDRIAERRKQRELRKQEALKRERAIMERYKQAKETGTQYDEAKYGPRPKEEDPSIGIEPEKPKKVLLISARPAYVTVKHKPGLSGTAPVRLRDERELEAHIAQGVPKGREDPAPKTQQAVAKIVPVTDAKAVKDEDGEDEEARKKREEERRRKEKDETKGKGGDDGLDRISNLMSALDGMKQTKKD